jgi:hypothetical protein
VVAGGVVIRGFTKVPDQRVEACGDERYAEDPRKEPRSDLVALHHHRQTKSQQRIRERERQEGSRKSFRHLVPPWASFSTYNAPASCKVFFSLFCVSVR